MIVQWKIKEFSKYLFDFNSKNYKDEKQIKEHAQNLKVFYNKPIEQIENGLKSKAVSKVVCASAEPAFFCTYKNGEQMISYTIIKRYKPTETPENKYGRYLVKFVVQNNMVQEYKILEEVLEPCRLWDSSEITLRFKDGEINENGMPMDISELSTIRRETIENAIEFTLNLGNYKRGSQLSNEEFKKVDELCRNFYLIMNQSDYRLYVDEAQKTYMIEKVKQFGYFQKQVEKFVNYILEDKRIGKSSQGLTANEYAFYLDDDTNTVIVFNHNILYFLDDGQWKYSISVDEMQLRKDDTSTYGYIVEKVTRRGNSL